jgi:hypothetical protein
MRAPGQPASVAQIRPISSFRTMLAMVRSAFQPLQIWRVRSAGSLPGCQFHSSGYSPVSNSPRKIGSKRSRASHLARVQKTLENQEAIGAVLLDLCWGDFYHRSSL